VPQRVEAARRLTIGGRVYVATVIVAGVAALALSLRELQLHALSYQWYMLAALTLVSGSATVNLSIGISISVSETFVFFAVLLFGPAAGTVMVALDGLVISFWMAKRRPEWYRALFNMAAPAISIWVASHLLFASAGIRPLLNQQEYRANFLLLPLALCAVVYFALNSWLIAFAVALEKRSSAYRIWRESSLLLSLNYFFGGSVALLLVVYTRDVDLTFIGVIVPLLLVSYLTYKTTMGRVEDANRHVDQLNRLYLSTIETLAMAIDAKDQVTHGHIRRVQMYAVRLANEVGVRDDKLIRAIEAAALLHDMGKLAVPEYILNKPGKLTESEFERMKLHASVGADILSAIEFPYPVVPIVRHHHENWDGTGYPDGLKGTEIPIGARILSVVDCFDALTSDRPYRPRLSDAEALEILEARRSTMYDPLIVDTFSRVHRGFPQFELGEPGPPRHALTEIATARATTAPQVAGPVLEEIAASADEMLTLYELARSLAGQVSVSDAGDVIANHLRRLIPSSLCAFYLCDDRTTEIEAKHVVGEGSNIVRGMRIAIGQRLSGWVAAHRQTIVNSDPTLDLGEAARSRSLALKSCISTPLTADDDKLIGVLTLYSGEVTAFNDDHRRIVEVVARQIAHTFRRALEFDESPRRDPLTGLPGEKQLESFIRSSLDDSSSANFALLLIDIDDLKGINATYGRAAGDDVLRHVVHQTRHGLRLADILFRSSGDELVAYLTATDLETANTVADRIRERISLEPVLLGAGGTVVVQATVTAVHVPLHGRSLDDLLAAARQRVRTAGTDAEGASVH
jgi:diguanylate cyclase (GGDEF)-like protein/putative nucleotidyltransferase with HDIG domain